MVKFYPPMEQILKKRVKPTPGEERLLNFLAECTDLPDDLEVYFQASLLGIFPDIILMRKGYGALIIEVKDYTLSCYSRKDSKIWEVTDEKGTYPCLSPVEQVQKYKKRFFDLYSAKLGVKVALNSRYFGVISTAVFFNGSSQEEIETFRPLEEMSKDEKYTDMVGYEILSPSEFTKLLEKKHLIGKYPSKLFTEDIYEEIRRIIKPSKHSVMKLTPVKLTRRQKELSDSRGEKQQKIRGLAGCGKTTVLAHRALDAYRKTREPVLILTFNITLCHYIHDYINSIRDQEDMEMFIIRHYHGFISDYSCKFGSEIDEKNYTLSSFPVKFKTILVDEVQDYETDWVRCIHKLLDNGGELCFFADEKQHVYERDNFIEDGEEKQKRIYTGVGGNWNKLSDDNKSFRLNGKIAELAHQFLEKYYKDYNDNKMMAGESSLFDASSVEYYFIDGLELDSIIEVFKETLKKYQLQHDDIAILSVKVETIRKIDQKIQNMPEPYTTITTFESEDDYNKLARKIADKKELKTELEKIRRIAKYNFYMESGKVKLSTVHSFKGWGVDTVIFILEADDGFRPPTRELIFTAMTRAKEHLIIVNIGNKEYDEFFREYVQ